jgi:hypothetical protein
MNISICIPLKLPGKIILLIIGIIDNYRSLLPSPKGLGDPRRQGFGNEGQGLRNQSGLT